MPYITGARLKAERAGVHFKELEAQARLFLEANPCAPSRHLDPEDFNYIIYDFPPQPATPDNLAIVLGDVAHNLRSALEHIAWNLALQRTDNPQRTGFPIFASVDRKKMENFKGLVKHIDPAPLRIIEALQPYNRTNPPEMDELWVLDAIWNTDKHQLHTRAPHRIGFPVFQGRGAYVRDFDDGSKQVRIPKSADPERNFEPFITQRVLFEVPRVPELIDVAFIQRIHHTVACAVVPLFAHYLPESTGLVERNVGLKRREGH